MKCINATKVVEKFKQLRSSLGENYKCNISEVIDILNDESFTMHVIELNKEYLSGDYLIETRWDNDTQYFKVRRR